MDPSVLLLNMTTEGRPVLMDDMKRHLILLISGSLPIWSSFVQDEEKKTRDWILIRNKMNSVYPGMNFTVDSIKSQWKCLRDCYRRERNRLVTGQIKSVKWKFYSLLSFLEDSGTFVQVDDDTPQRFQMDEMMDRSREHADRHRHLMEDEIPIQMQALFNNDCRSDDTDTSGHVKEEPTDYARDAHDESPTVEMSECSEFNSAPKMRKRPRIEKPTVLPATVTPCKLDKFEILGQMVTQTLREMSSHDALSTEQAFTEVEFALCKLRQEVLQKRKKQQETYQE